MNTQQSSRLTGAALTLAFVAMGYGAGSLSGQTANLDLTLTLVTPTPTCSATVDAVDFGQFDAGSMVATGGLSTPFNLNFNCTGTVAAATATIDGGQNPGGGTPIRQLSDGSGNLINYLLYESATNLISHDETITFALPAGSQSVALSAFLISQALPTTIGAYTDQVTITFTF